MVCSYGIGYVNMRLDKFLADMGAGTRSDIKKDIRKGKVTVGGETVKSADLQVDPESDVCYCGRKITYAVNEYYMVNKPAGVISASDDARQSTVIDLLPDEKRQDLFPVGRLDKDTTGFVLITDDGEFAHRILSPKNHIDKTYVVSLRDNIEEEAVSLLENGITLRDGTAFLPSKIKILSDKECEITICEGKYHQIKRMFCAVGNEVTNLRRIKMGRLFLDERLRDGECREITADELKMISEKE